MSPGKWEVLHAINPTFGMGKNPPLQEYQIVAVIGPETAKSLEDVFMLTNHIDYDWRKSRWIKTTPEAKRSTSVGDIVIDPKGTVWRCMSCGWEEVK
jgi:hypothetical protein